MGWKSERVTDGREERMRRQIKRVTVKVKFEFSLEFDYLVRHVWGRSPYLFYSSLFCTCVCGHARNKSTSSVHHPSLSCSCLLGEGCSVYSSWNLPSLLCLPLRSNMQNVSLMHARGFRSSMLHPFLLCLSPQSGVHKGVAHLWSIILCDYCLLCLASGSR